MLVVTDPWLHVDCGIGDQGKGSVLDREFELLTCRYPHMVVPEVQLVTHDTVMAIQATQAGQCLVELQQLRMQERRLAVGDYQQGCIAQLQPLVQTLTPALQLFCGGGFSPAAGR